MSEPLSRTTAHVLSLALLGAGLSFAAAAPVAAEAAVPTFRCDDGSLYLTRADGTVSRVQASTGALAAAPVAGGPVVAGNVDGGAVDPTTGRVYHGAYVGPTLELQAYDPGTHAPVGGRLRVEVPRAPGPEGDFAFDGAGRLHLVASSTARATFYVAPGPGAGSTSLAKSRSITATVVRTTAVPAAVTGLAFASDGRLYASTASTLRSVDPASGVWGTSRSLGVGPAVTDLGSCAAPGVLPGRTDLPRKRARSRDLAEAVAPSLSVVASASPLVATGTGQRVAYAVVVTNSGASTLRGVVVAAVAPGLSRLGCAPTAQGGTLAAGARTTCTASRTTDEAYLRSYGDRVTAQARGTAADGTTVTATGTVRTTASTPPPKATDDTVTIANGTSSVTLPASTNDSAGAADGAPVIASAGRFPRQPGLYTDSSTSASTTRGDFEALPDGRVLFRVTSIGRISWEQKVVYKTVDAAGHSALSTLTVIQRSGPKAVDNTVRTTQGDAVTVHPLGNDTPGVTVAGRPAPFVVGSLRFPAVQLVQDPATQDHLVDYADVAPDGRSMTVPFRGTFTIDGDAVRFVPAPGFDRDIQVVYTVEDTLGNVARANIDFQVSYSQPTLRDDQAVTTYGHPVTVPVLQNDVPGVVGHTLDVAGFDDQGHTFRGQDLSTPEGTWSLDDRGTPVFAPADGFSGVATVEYAVDEATATGTVLGFPQPYLGVWGGRYTARASVTVRKGPATHVLVLSTPHNVSGTVDPTSGAVPGSRLDGTPGSFVPGRTVFTTQGQPAGSRVGADQKSLLLASGGSLTVSPTGQIAYAPAPGFVGFAGTVRYRLGDDTTAPDGTGGSVEGRLLVLATGTVPVASDDEATTSSGAPVRLPAAVDDDRGGSASLVVTFPAAGQPSGSTLSSSGTRLVVPGEGTWAVGGDGSVAFAPVPGLVDAASPVVYRVQGSSGSATARLLVTVGNGPTARPDVAALTSVAPTWVDPIANDVPGRNADGTLGTIDRASLRFATSGQPAGTSVSADGKDLSLPARDGRPAFSASVYFNSGTAMFSAGSTAFRGTSPAFRYEVGVATRDSTGKAATTMISSTFKARFTGRDALARDDATTVSAGQTATLYPDLNDVPSSYLGGLSGLEFPKDQLGDLPPGSTIDRHCFDPEDGCQYFFLYVKVPGEGIWENSYDGSVTFIPEPRFVGTTTPVRYEEGDAQGPVEAYLSVTVLPPGAVRPDRASTPQGEAVTIDTLANDTVAQTPEGAPQPPDLSRVVFPADGQPAGSSFPTDRDLLVPKEGLYLLDVATARVTFRPDPAFHGTASPVLVQVGAAVERVQVVVNHVDPAASPDEVTTTGGAPAVVAVLENDDPGLLARPLVASSVRLRSSPGLPHGSGVSESGRLLTVAGRGTFAVGGDGTVTFYPWPGWTGTLAPVRYDVADVNGSRTLSTLTVRVKA